MFKVFNKISVLSFSLMILATSCTKTGATGPNGIAGTNGSNGAPGPTLTGNIQGLISLYDVSGVKILPPTDTLSGDSIILTNVSSGAVIKTITGGNGTYTFTNVSTGTYSMVVNRQGYGRVLAYGSQFVGGGTIDKNFALSKIPTTNIITAVAKDTTFAVVGAGNVPEKYVRVRGSVPVSGSTTTVIIYVSQAANSFVDITPGNYSTYYTTTISPGVSKFNFYIPTSNLYDLGFPSGNVSNVYFAAYILSGNTNASTYTDWNTQQTVFTALSSTPINVNAPVQ